ncbi:MAG: proline dehydrogenase [Acidobacteria bacterium]|nr:MAG: proline dehydrogenase [Acidobacteriota bacterium]
MLDTAAKAFFHLLARSPLLQRLASRYGMRSSSSFARRFIAGESVDEAIAAARKVEAQGLLQTLDYLGESIGTLADADTATREYLTVIDAVVGAGIGRNLSLKLTQIGLAVDRASTVDNLRRILDRASGFFVRIDMENSPYTEVTLNIFETLWNQGYRHMGVVLQADLRRSEADLDRINQLGARIRLVKGAYREPKAIAYQKKAEVDLAFARLMRRLLVEGNYPAVATHDPTMLDLARKYADELGVGRDRFEFQMLYGIRRDLQAALHSQGYRVRVYIPFGRQWFPYFMRRLGERPANVGFVLRGILGEGGYQ